MENDSLPKKCCAKCGFLYGLTTHAKGLEYAIFDPDIIRLENLEPKSDRTVISSYPYLPLPEYATPTSAMNQHTLSDTEGFHCLKNKIRLPVIQDWDQVKNIIRQDRENCDGFYQYHPGYSPSQHIELQLEEKRVSRQEQHEKKLAEWSYKQESRWSQISLELEKKRMQQEDAWRNLETRLTIRLGIVGAILIAIQTLVMVILGLYFS